MTSGFSPKLQSDPSEMNKNLGTFAIVLVLAALLSAGGMGFLYYQKKEQERARLRANTPVIYDGRLIGNAAQMYLLTTGQTQVTFGYNSATGEISGDLTPWLKDLRKGYSIPDTTIEANSTNAFSLRASWAFKGQIITFSDEGKTTFDPARDY